MGGTRKKKYETGEGARFWTRAMAMKKLQLSLKDFRRICILKGIYPREPRNRKRAQKGSTGIKTLYNKKDIQFLMHDPIIWKIRDMKVHGRKIGRAKAMREFGRAKKLIRRPPTMQLDHIIKERYPTFLDALKDLDDCLTLCFLFSTFPSLNHVPRDQTALCRRLTLEFLHVVIASKALRKVFISIKGYYFQAEIKGIPITWIIPHHFSFEPQSKEEVDFRIMSTFVQFYVVLLGFVNFRLYHCENLHYPPKFSIPIEKDCNELVDKKDFTAERIAALNAPISSVSTEALEDDEVEIDQFNMDNDDPSAEEKAQIEAQKVQKLKNLFKGLRVFLNREVPREPLTFVLRCFGAEVSWDKTLFLGSTFIETDETITHQIVDRPNIDTQYMSRYYIQPQWVFDSVNARELLPVEKYFIGCVLPPHLSPFVDDTRTQYYIPPEAMGKDSILEPDEIEGQSEENKESSEENENKSEEVSEKEEEEEVSEKEEEEEEEEVSEKEEEEEEEDDNDDDDSDDDESSSEEQNIKKEEMKRKMKVQPGKIIVEDPIAKRREEREEFKLREKMIEKKHRALYRSMMKGRAARMRDVRVLRQKRKLIDHQKSIPSSS